MIRMIQMHLCKFVLKLNFIFESNKILTIIFDLFVIYLI